VTDAPRDSTGDEQPTELRDSNPNAGGPEPAAGGMGISSERVGATGGGAEGTDGEKDTSAPAHADHAGDLIGSDAEFEPGSEENPEGIDPKAGYPSHDPRSEDAPYKDA
jgi:hypothetical protein